ncbi:MAG: hypothetical protein ACTSU5_02455 [Promethearchaeota archaeon]
MTSRREVQASGKTALLDQRMVRELPGWDDAPVPVCMGGDYRALTFCCKPGYSLTFGFKCRRDEVLREVGLTQEEFVGIKENFSGENDPCWDSDRTCFGSLAYCCMRRGGCSRRDPVLFDIYSGMAPEEVFREYFSRKKALAKRILERAKNQALVGPYLELL